MCTLSMSHDCLVRLPLVVDGIGGGGSLGGALEESLGSGVSTRAPRYVFVVLVMLSFGDE